MNVNMKKCPMCAEEIPLGSATCEYCGAHFEVVRTGYCQNCHNVREADEQGRCKVCGSEVLDVRLQSRLIEQPTPVHVPGSTIPTMITPKPRSSRWACIVIPLVVLMVGIVLALIFLPKALKLLLPDDSPLLRLVQTPISILTRTPVKIPAVSTQASAAGETPAQPLSPGQSGEYPTPFPTFTALPALPPGESGAATGRILWNSQPMQGVTVKLCTDWSMIGGCKTAEYTGITGSDGRYTIDGLPPGEYDLATIMPDQENETGWLGIKVTSVAGQSATVRDLNLSKRDLRLSAPMDNETVKTATPTLEWEPYPDAAYYKVYVSNTVTYQAVVSFEKATDTHYVFKIPLDPVKYYWSIDAYNANGIKISGSGISYFVVAP